MGILDPNAAFTTKPMSPEPIHIKNTTATF